MRRKDCEITDKNTIFDIMRRCDAVRIGMVDGEGYAYIVPVNFGMEIRDGTCSLFFHSAVAGKKIQLLKENSKVSFQIKPEISKPSATSFTLWW